MRTTDRLLAESFIPSEFNRDADIRHERGDRTACARMLSRSVHGHGCGPLLYWVPSPQSQGSHVRPQALCGVGIQSDEQVTVSVETTKGSSAPSGLPTLTVSANSQGSFAADYVPEVPCASAQQQFEVRAHGNKGSTSSVSMPPTLQTGCAPA